MTADPSREQIPQAPSPAQRIAQALGVTVAPGITASADPSDGETR